MFIIEGNIGVGKSTFLKLIAEHDATITPIFEPVQQWQTEINGKSILTEFYSNPHRWAFTMETIAMASRIQDHIAEQNSQRKTDALIERSIYSGHYCFAVNDYHAGFLSELEWHIYNNWFNTLAEKCTLPKGFIYLKVDPIIAQKRMIKRSRSGEEPISLEYLQQIDAKHEDFLIHKKNLPDALSKVPVLILDCNIDFEEDKAYAQEIIQKMITFIKNR